MKRGVLKRWIFYPLIYLALCVLVPSCVHLADKFILFPQPSEGAPGAEQIFAGDPRVELWRVPLEEPKGYAVRFYGNGDLADRWVVGEAREYAALGIELWAANYPGYGASAPPATLAGVARAAELAFDTVRARAGGKPIMVIGTSLGTTAALHLTATRPVASAVFINPPALRELIMGEFGWWNLWIMARMVSRQVPAELDSVTNAAASTAPALFISSDDDEVVPAKYHTMIIDAYGGGTTVIRRAKATHNTPLTHDERRRILSAAAAMVSER